MINLELYRIFYVVAVTGNITKASEQLCISQPAVTKQIKNLESCKISIPPLLKEGKDEKGEKVFQWKTDLISSEKFWKERYNC